MLKSTDDLNIELITTYDIHNYVADNAAELDNVNFIDFLTALIDQCGKSKVALSDDACISEPFLYNILNAKKKPSRDSVIKLAFGLELDVETTERLLMLAGYRNFYVRHKRDALLKHARRNNMDTIEANNLLKQHGFKLVEYKRTP